ncbi:MAG: hypothetical protein MR333_08570 [Porphyromonadaceae bacterium]|nr:hypothetical protein [Porphyromonadaceae bacterium]
MASNRVKRNIWLTLAVLNVGAIANHAIGVADGSLEWWQLVSTIVISLFCIKFFLCYHKQVKLGNLFGAADPLGRKRRTSN